MYPPLYRLFKILARIFSGSVPREHGFGRFGAEPTPEQHRVIAAAEPVDQGVVFESVLKSGTDLERLKPYLQPTTLEEVRRFRLADELAPDEPGFASADQDFRDIVAEMEVLRDRCAGGGHEPSDGSGQRYSQGSDEKSERPSVRSGSTQEDGRLRSGLSCGSLGPLKVSRMEAVQALMRDRVERDVVERPDVRIDRDERN